MKTSSRLGATLTAVGLAALGVAFTFTPGCDDAASCISLCEEAQAGACTSIKGDCTAFCNAAEGIRLNSGCGDEQDAYEACLGQGPVCQQTCGSPETAYRNCATGYCITHSDDNNCKTLANSF